MPIKILIAAAFISLLPACSSLPTLGECHVDYPYQDIDIMHLSVPQPITLQAVSGIDANDGRVSVSTDGMSDIIQWQHEVDRFNRDLREWWKNVLQSVDDQNAANRGVLQEK